MRIISKFQDYYDIGMSYGQDQTLIYDRVPLETIIEDNAYGERQNLFQDGCRSRGHSLGIDHERFVVGFCGKTYMCYRLEAVIPSTPYALSTKVFTYAYSAQAVKLFVQAYMSNSYFQSYMKPVPKGYWRTSFKHEHIVRRFDEFNGSAFENYFLETKTVLFIADRKSGKKETIITKDACLKDISFYKVIDPYTAYQEIAMFIGGVLGIGEPHMIDISNEDMRDAKGFNDKSFKTRPGTKPNRKRKKDK